MNEVNDSREWPDVQEHGRRSEGTVDPRRLPYDGRVYDEAA